MRLSIGHQHPRGTYIICAAALLLCFAPIVAAENVTNMTEHYRLCHTGAEIAALQEQYGLTRVDATPTHAAFHPGWPETLVTIVLCIVTLFTSLNLDDEGATGWFSVVTKGLIPLVVLGFWFSSFIISEHQPATAGWVCANLMLGIAPIINCVQSLEGDTKNLVATFLVLFLSIPQVVCCMAITFQRFDESKGFGKLAYNITDARGCLPANGFAYLEKGARSETFRTIQAVQLFGSLVIWGLLAGCLGGADETGAGLHALATIVVNIGVIIYEAIIARQGSPVVISGDCMLVEMNPRLGFLDSEIDTYWKVLVGVTGL